MFFYCNFVVLLKMIFSEILMRSFSCCVGKRFYFEDDFSFNQRFFFLFCSVGKLGVLLSGYLFTIDGLFGWLVWNKKDSDSGDTSVTGILLDCFPNSIQSSESLLIRLVSS